LKGKSNDLKVNIGNDNIFHGILLFYSIPLNETAGGKVMMRKYQTESSWYFKNCDSWFDL